MVVSANQRVNIRGVADPFFDFPATPGSYVTCTEVVDNSACLLDWRIGVNNGDTTEDPGEKAHDRHGRPYLLFDMASEDLARLISMGPNGRYEGAVCGTSCDQCPPLGDDLQVCLLR